jgi:hypothetical protein
MRLHNGDKILVLGRVTGSAIRLSRHELRRGFRLFGVRLSWFADRREPIADGHGAASEVAAGQKAVNYCRNGILDPTSNKYGCR